MKFSFLLWLNIFYLSPLGWLGKKIDTFCPKLNFSGETSRLKSDAEPAAKSIRLLSHTHEHTLTNACAPRSSRARTPTIIPHFPRAGFGGTMWRQCGCCKDLHSSWLEQKSSPVPFLFLIISKNELLNEPHWHDPQTTGLNQGDLWRPCRTKLRHWCSSSRNICFPELNTETLTVTVTLFLSAHTDNVIIMRTTWDEWNLANAPVCKSPFNSFATQPEDSGFSHFQIQTSFIKLSQHFALKGTLTAACPQTSPKRCASMRIPAHLLTKPGLKFPTVTQLLLQPSHTHNTKKWNKIKLKNDSYLDGLRRLAFNLMRYGGRLVHLETPIQSSYPSETERSGRKAKRVPSLRAYSMGWRVESGFSLCSVEARNRIWQLLYVHRAAQRGRDVHKWLLVIGSSRGERGDFWTGGPGDNYRW